VLTLPPLRDLQLSRDRLDVMNDPAIIVDYDPAWPGQYAAEQHLLAERLGPGAITIHHVGSTSVPGLAAKPVIDICIECATYPPTPQIISALESLG
jgi:GrpB-like predicted nucleotidyltransferase (UPF0157 family)